MGRTTKGSLTSKYAGFDLLGWDSFLHVFSYCSSVARLAFRSLKFYSVSLAFVWFCDSQHRENIRPGKKVVANLCLYTQALSGV